MSARPGPIRVLAIDHTAGVAPFRRKFAALARRPGIELTVLAPDRWVENYREVRLDGPRERVIDGYRLCTGGVVWPGFENRGFFVSGLRRAVRISRPEVLHLWEEPYSFIAFQALWARRLWAPRARTLFYSADNQQRSFRYPWRPAWLYKQIELHTFRACARGTALSGEVQDVLRGKGFQGPIDIVPLALDPEDYPMGKESGVSSPGRAGTGFRIGYAGRLLHVKGVDILVRAFASLPPDPGVELWIVGDGPERSALRALASDLGISERVRFRDPVAHEAMPEIYRSLDVTVLPSRTLPHIKEQFGRLLLEAMACGCPVIGSSSGGIPETVGDAGLVFPEGDIAALSAALSRVRSEPGLAATLRERGRRRVLETFTWEARARQLASIYDELARSLPRR